jgi:hypothetical protein
MELRIDLKKSSKGPASATSVSAKRAETDRQTTIVRNDRFITRKDMPASFEECQFSSFPNGSNFLILTSTVP